MRPRRCASCRREPACDEIWISTLASGMSMELSPTLDRKTVLTCIERVSVSLVLGSVQPRRMLRDAAQAGALRFGRRGCSTCCAWARVRHQTRETLGPRDAGGCVSLPASSTRSPTRTHSAAGARARAERSPHRASPGSGARLGVALEGGQHARALLVRRAAVDEWLAQPLRVLAQRKDVVREHDDLVAAHLCARAPPPAAPQARRSCRAARGAHVHVAVSGRSESQRVTGAHLL